MPPAALLYSGVWGMSCIRTERAQTDWAESWLTFDLSSDTSVYMENIMTIKKDAWVIKYHTHIKYSSNTNRCTYIYTSKRVNFHMAKYFRDHFQ